MDTNKDIIKQGQELVEKLTKIKEAYINNEKELLFSIRKDVVAVELKDILESNPDYYQLKNALENYISKLLNTAQ